MIGLSYNKNDYVPYYYFAHGFIFLFNEVKPDKS